MADGEWLTMTTDQQDQQIRLSDPAHGQQTAGMADSESSDPSGPHEPGLPGERLRFRAADSEASFPLAMRRRPPRRRGRNRVHGVRALVADLEADQTREGAVQKALDDVGIETASILQRAHATADALTARSASRSRQSPAAGRRRGRPGQARGRRLFRAGRGGHPPARARSATPIQRHPPTGRRGLGHRRRRHASGRSSPSTGLSPPRKPAPSQPPLRRPLSAPSACRTPT